MYRSSHRTLPSLRERRAVVTLPRKGLLNQQTGQFAVLHAALFLVLKNKTMSETETHIGKLTEIKPMTEESLYHLSKRLLEDEGIKEFSEDPFIQLQEDLYGKYFVYNDKIYKIEDKEISGDIMEAHKNEDGTINYTVQFYNGGCCLSEAMEYALKPLNL